ncbi:histidine phosphatase family protein [Gordonia sp. HY002]|uniref:histidine phosphatase family protein n=1 Tax=Gordonia zhenghanii TaxID=2911516 RepID=UPI001EF13E22|nr:histidine phosphatase family protein [Gordonia zhenghanii]MCF8571560.1 histidine phosphatase family protein [Gordonia zhenghanii]MCF8602157.1 histidine phosphatase family protein [Gordonia zhenghanii]
MARLHLVRHGETTSNVMRILDTALPGASLTDFGARQGVRFGLEHPDGKPAVLAHSVASRARQTADMIASVWEADTVELDGVHEVQVGDLEGLSDKESHEKFHDVVTRWHHGELAARIPGGESLEMLHERYLPVIDELTRKYVTGEGRDVYLVSHGAAIRLIAAHLSGIDSEFALKNYLPNTGSVVLEPGDTRWTVSRWGVADLADGDGSPADPMG